ncbi:ABC-type antimicrobial peptide transport system, permease component [Dyadobacter soli]|uniref:ABC-type antimicrobial peptide transport system, permease component n=1 Tax=Dyadobacter soli TaxID=659014 RepID=A0A1G7SJB1_9BACT|nr:ABC transporter permease [Dyadobacter soli]SDG22982.1 ABC-type antimicrobial peptide transport system, permease component [Dyadobacter soli]
MINNYARIAFRSFKKNKVYTFINISGLALSLTATLLISLWIWDEWNYNKGNANYARVGRVMSHTAQNGQIASSPNLPFPLAAELREKFPADFEHVAVSWDTEDYNLLANGNKFRKKGRFMEPDGAHILAPRMLAGTLGALGSPSQVLISESAAISMFGKTDPLGQALKIDNELEALVAGVYKDFPSNSDYYNLSFIAPWKLFASAQRRQWVNNVKDNWNVNTFEILVQVKKTGTIEATSARITHLLENHLSQAPGTSGSTHTIALHAMDKWHLYSSWENGVNTGGDIYYVKLFAAIAAFILLLACINFMNLSTARSEQRAKEIGVRKVVGSRRAQLIAQFIMESLVVVTASFLIALACVQIALPEFNAITSKQIEFMSRNGLAFNAWFLLIAVVFCILVSFVAGSYPALYLSALKPVKVLKSGSANAGRLSATPRKALVVLQFTISITLIIGAAGVFRQMQFGQNRATGYDRQGLVYVKIPPGSSRLDALKNDLLHSAIVSSVAQSSGPVTDLLSNARGFSWPGKSPVQGDEFAVIAASHRYGHTVGWQVVQGRDFSEKFVSDSSAVIINEAAAKYMGLADPIGKTIRWKDGTFNDSEYRVVGVVRDMVMQSPFEPVRQAIYFMTYAPNYLYIKLDPEVRTGSIMPSLNRIFNRHLPGNVFDFQFADQQYDLKFKTESKIGTITLLFAAIAIFTSCLGLFGLAAYTAEQRRSEIGIRKVLGASVTGIWKLVAKDFVLLTIAAIAIAMPVSYYLLNLMLEKYQYRSQMPWWLFSGSGALALALTILTVSYQAIKAALTDPVKALRSE